MAAQVAIPGVASFLTTQAPEFVNSVDQRSYGAFQDAARSTAHSLLVLLGTRGQPGVGVGGGRPKEHRMCQLDFYEFAEIVVPAPPKRVVHDR